VTSKAKTIRSTDPTQPFDLEANKAIALRLVEVFNGRQLDLLEDVLHPEFHERGLSAFPPAGSEAGPGARRKLYERFLQAIPDARAEVLDILAQGDKVVILDRFGGTHQGEFFGRSGIGLISQSADTHAERIAPLLVSPDLEGHSGAMFDPKGFAIFPSPNTHDYMKKFIGASEPLVSRTSIRVAS
jgi:hypothetical protein